MPQSLEYVGENDRFVDPKYVNPILGAWNGAESAPLFLSGIDDNVNPAATFRNRGTGAGLLVQDTLGTTDLLGVDDLGTTLTNLFGSGTAEIDGNTLLGALLNVVGAGTFQSTLDVTDDGTFGANVEIAGNLTVGGTFTLTGAATLTGALTVNGAFVANGAVTLGNAAGDAISVLGTMSVTPLATFAGGLTLSGGVLTLPAGAVGAPSLAIGEATTGLFRPAAGALAVTLAGTERARWTAAGLGIGEPTPLRALHVVTGGQTPTAITTGSNAFDAVVVDGVTAGQATINLVVASGTGTGGFRVSTPTTINRGQIVWSESGAEWLLRSAGTLMFRATATGISFFGSVAAPQATGGAATAGAAYTSDEQDMIQIMWDALRAYGLLS